MNVGTLLFQLRNVDPNTPVLGGIRNEFTGGTDPTMTLSEAVFNETIDNVVVLSFQEGVSWC